MKTKNLVVILFLIISLAMTFPVQAQSTTTGAPGSWTSSINIQNVGTGAATVVVDFYDTNGSKANSFTIGAPNTIPAGGSRTLVIAFDIPGLNSGQYSVIVSSDQPLVVIANSTSSSPTTAGAYQGVASENLSTTLFFPGLYKNYYGFYSEILLQNSETAAADVTIDFYNPTTGDPIPAAQITGSIPATSTRGFILANYAGIPSGGANGQVSAKVTSTKKLAGIANNWSAAVYGEFSDYNAFIGGSTTTYAPGLYNAYYSFVSALTVQNVGTVPTNILVTYSNGTTSSTTLKPFQSIAYYQPGIAGLPSGNTNGIFSAKIESIGTGGNAAQPIVGLVNVEQKVKGLLGSYNTPSGPTTKVGCPIVMKSYYGWFTGTTIQNVGTLATDIKVTYASGQTRNFPNVAVNGTVAAVELGATSPLPGTSAVSALIESLNGQPLVAVVQEDNDRYSSKPGDYLLAYTCVPQP